MAIKRTAHPSSSSNIQQVTPTSTISAPNELSASFLSLPCDPQSLGFETTNDLPDLTDVIGQPRALRALDLGSEVSGPGYNIFVLGQPGSGRTTLSREYLQRKAANEPTPDDWCYVNHFDDPRKPLVLRLPAGRGSGFRSDLQDFIEYCLREIPRAFESKEYSQHHDRLLDEIKKKQETEFLRLQDYAQKFNFMVARTPYGFVLAPTSQGQPLTPEDVGKLSPDQREKFKQLQEKLSIEVEITLHKLRELAQYAEQKLAELKHQTVVFLIDPEIKTILEKYQGLEAVQQHLQRVYKDIITNAGLFLTTESGESHTLASKPDAHQRYAVNLLVDNSETLGAPVIVETHPVYHNLLGRVEHEVIMGATRTDFTMIQPGAFHRANGGYLILPARDVLVNPYAWEGLKRVLRDGCLRIIELGSQLGLLSTETLEPEPIPLKIKIILIGTPMLYYLLQAYDDDFNKLFKVQAEFATSMDRNPDAEKEYGLFVKSVVMDNDLPPFSSEAVARIIEFSARLAEDQQKLSTRFGRISDLVRESAYWARKNGDLIQTQMVSAKAVEQAIAEGIFRNNLLDERLQEMLAQNILMVDTQGSAIGRVNALSVYQLGDFSFGRPSRLTAAVAPGGAGVVDIERQAKLGGPVHTKGVLILNGYLNNRYADKNPLNLTASLTFEQTYSQVEGDSASAAELFALLSACTGIPLRQDLAVTGSVNQYGQVQAVGGINEKIEGFFDTCRAKGPCSSQGVLIPQANVRHLMLRFDVIRAVENGEFHIYPIQTIDEGLQVLTGIPAGEQDEKGEYPQGSFNRRVMDKLGEYAKILEKTDRKKRETKKDSLME